MCEADGRITSGLVFVPVQLNVFDEIGINHLPMNSGVGSLNSLWLPLHICICICICICIYIYVAVEVLGVSTRVGHRRCTHALQHVRHTRSLRGR